MIPSIHRTISLAALLNEADRAPPLPPPPVREVPPSPVKNKRQHQETSASASRVIRQRCDDTMATAPASITPPANGEPIDSAQEKPCENVTNAGPASLATHTSTQRSSQTINDELAALLTTSLENLSFHAGTQNEELASLRETSSKSNKRHRLLQGTSGTDA